MKLQGKQKYSPSQTICTKQSLSAGVFGLQGSVVLPAQKMFPVIVPPLLNPTCNELESTQVCPDLCVCLRVYLC